MKWYIMTIWACMALAACSSPEASFEAAEEQGTAEAYLAFVEKYPDHELAGRAEIAAARLEWEAIKDGTDPALFSDYVDRYSAGEFRAEAAARAENLEFDAARGESTTAALESFLEKHPDTRYRDEAEDLRVAFAYDEARDRDEPEGWRTFLGRFPGSRFEADVVDALLATCDIGASLRYEESIAAGSGFMESAPDGTIKSYPEGTSLSVTITDNGDGTSYSTSGRYLTMVEEYALFELNNGHFYVRLPSGYLTPCFCPGFVPTTSDQAPAAERVYDCWRLQRLQELAAFVKESSGTGDRERISIMGALQIPHARRQIAALQESGDDGIREMVRRSARISQAIAAKTCPSQ